MSEGIVNEYDSGAEAASDKEQQFLRRQRAASRFRELSSRIAEAYADVPRDEGMAEIDAAVGLERGR